jgi:hypothetical protein
VQSYTQNVRPDDKLDQVPVSDQYMIGRVDFGKAFVAGEYASRGPKHGWFRDSFHFLTQLSLLFHLENSPTGFMDMMFIDPSGFDEQHYEFQYVRREFLGTVRTVVFDVRPRVKGAGRFYGRIWVEDQNGNVVRFNGTYTNNPVDEVNHYFHFDSWRTNIRPGVWAPASVHVEDAVQTFSRRTQGFRGHTTCWGYSLKLPTRDSDAESMEIEGAQDQSDSGQDVSPLEAKRQWIAQAEQNVLDRLTQAGLVAPPSDFDKVLEQVANNIIISNGLQLPSDIHCRVILTDPLETLTRTCTRDMATTKLPQRKVLLLILVSEKVSCLSEFLARTCSANPATVRRAAISKARVRYGDLNGQLTLALQKAAEPIPLGVLAF